MAPPGCSLRARRPVTPPSKIAMGETRAYLRIDDFPSTGYEFATHGTVDDTDRGRRLMAVIRATSRHGVVPEFMVCTHVVDRAGHLHGIDELYPGTVRLMRRLADEGQLIVNAHGMLHLREKLYLERGVVDAREFLGLGEEETARRLDIICDFIVRIFGRKPRGFVAPAWGYETGTTKRVASRYFDYIADSYDSWQAGTALPFGTLDPQDGFVHFPETWRYGLYSVERSNPHTWARAIASRSPVHLMQHGHRIPGEWRSILERALVEAYGQRLGNGVARRVLPERRLRPRRMIGLGAATAGLAGVVTAFGVSAAPAVAAALGGILLAGAAPGLVRSPATIRDLRRASLNGILAAAATAGVRWGTLEALAIEIKTAQGRAAVPR